MDGIKFELAEPAPLLTRKQVARFMKLSERTVWSESEPRGTIPVIVIGRSIRYCPNAIQDWMKRRMEAGGNSKTLGA